MIACSARRGAAVALALALALSTASAARVPFGGSLFGSLFGAGWGGEQQRSREVAPRVEQDLGPVKNAKPLIGILTQPCECAQRRRRLSGAWGGERRDGGLGIRIWREGVTSCLTSDHNTPPLKALWRACGGARLRAAQAQSAPASECHRARSAMRPAVCAAAIGPVVRRPLREGGAAARGVCNHCYMSIPTRSGLTSPRALSSGLRRRAGAPCPSASTPRTTSSTASSRASTDSSSP